MTISFNHTIVAARDKRESAEFLAELFGLPSPKPFGHFMVVALEHGVNLDYADAPEGEEIRRQHYAFLVSERSSTRSTARSSRAACSTGPTRVPNGPARSTTGTAAAECTSRIPPGMRMEILTRPYGLRAG